MKFNILICIVDRANYGRLLPLLTYLKHDDRFKLSTCFLGNTTLHEYGSICETAHLDGIVPTYRLFSSLKGSSHSTMLQTISNTISQLNLLFQEKKPDLVYVIGDRYEALGCAIAASYNNILVAHIQGGELSGTIDETTRHVITKLSHLHFPATSKAAEVITSMGENPSNVFAVGCPVTDYALQIKNEPFDASILEPYVEPHRLSAFNNGFILASMHPVTTNIEESVRLTRILQEALQSSEMPVLWITPNIDPGSKDIIPKLIQSFPFCYTSNISTRTYQLLLKSCRLAIGNSSSYVRDSALYGTPVIILGSRQHQREAAANVTFLANPTQILLQSHIESQLIHGFYPPSTIYGDGLVSARIADHSIEFLSKKPSAQKYFHDALLSS